MTLKLLRIRNILAIELQPNGGVQKQGDCIGSGHLTFLDVVFSHYKMVIFFALKKMTKFM